MIIVVQKTSPIYPNPSMLPDTAAGEALNSVNATLNDLAKKEGKAKTMFPGQLKKQGHV